MSNASQDGESLDEQFYTGGQFGLTLFASRCDEVLETYEIEIGDLVAPMAGLGTIWHVMFNDDGTVDWVSHVGNWFS